MTPLPPIWSEDDLTGAGVRVPLLDVEPDDNRSGRSSTVRSSRGVTPATTTDAPSQAPNLMEYSEGVEFGLTPRRMQAIRAEAPSILRAGSYSSPDWGTDVSLSGMEANERARQMIEGGYRNRMQDIINTEKQAQAIRALPETEQLQRAGVAAKTREFELAPRRAEMQLEQQARAQEAQQSAWDEFGEKVSKLDEALTAYHQSGGQPPGGKAQGIDDRGYAIAKQQLFRELLAKLQTITGKPYGQLGAPMNLGQEPFQMGGAEPTYGPSRVAEGE
jgi:hypothetical protein